MVDTLNPVSYTHLDVYKRQVPGSWMVDAQIRKEGIDKILTEAGFAIRQPG